MKKIVFFLSWISLFFICPIGINAEHGWTNQSVGYPLSNTSNPHDIYFNNTDWLVLNFQNTLDVYNASFSYMGSHSLTGVNFESIENNGSDYFVLSYDGVVYQYNDTFNGEIGSYNLIETYCLEGLGFNGSNWFVSDVCNDTISVFDMSFNSLNISFNVSWLAPSPYPSNMVYNDSYWWLLDRGDDIVHRVDNNFQSTNFNYTISEVGSALHGIFLKNETVWYVVDDDTDQVIVLYDDVLSSSVDVVGGGGGSSVEDVEPVGKCDQRLMLLGDAIKIWFVKMQPSLFLENTVNVVKYFWAWLSCGVGSSSIVQTYVS